ncbi:MAG: hypothetical protein V3V14_10170 [Saprospiraceae bacterium]
MAYQKLQSSRAAAVTPSDTANIPSVSGPAGETVNNGCVLYVGGLGDVRVLTAGGDDVVFSAVPAGTFVPVNVVRVFSTNTTATNIVALW